VAGFVGIPAAILPSGSAIEHFLEPSFTAEHRVESAGVQGRPDAARESAAAEGERESEKEPELSRGVEWALMGFSVLVAIGGIFLARTFYQTSPETSERLAERFAGAH